MALNGKFISFQSIIEAVYRKAGYQQIDWGQAVEIIGETIGLIGALPAYGDITTNGINGAPVPLEVKDYRAAVPQDMVALKALRRVILEEEPTDDGSDLKISRFIPMVEATDQFYQSIRDQWNESIPVGTYNYTEYTQVETVVLQGTGGTAIITEAGDLIRTLVFNTDIKTTVEDFVAAYATDYLAKGIIITEEDENLVFTSNQSGVYFKQPVINPSTGDLFGTVTGTRNNSPVIVYGQEYKINYEAQYEYKINNGFIHTNFEDGKGFIELVYTGYVKDVHGFPMIPDDPKFVEAVRWSLIQNLDYKKWRTGQISDKVFQYSEQQRDWYVAAARSKASIPSLDKMEAIKNMFLRSIPKVNEHNSYFKYSNVPEQRYTYNSKATRPRFYHR